MTGRLLAAVIAVLLGLGVATGGCNRTRVAGKRVVVLGFDGLDYTVTRALMARGRLPAFSRLAAAGGFTPLGTTIPPQSPVAWSSFITGLDPGQHGIFDFIHRDPKTMVPYLSTTRTEGPGRTLKVSRWQFPLSAGKVELLREGRPFWDVLEGRGIETTIVRMPANFPPSGKATRELSGMGTPDILGSYGTFSYYTSDPSVRAVTTMSGGVAYPVDVVDGTMRSAINGPANPFRVEPETLRAPFAAYVDTTRTYVKIVVGDEERLLHVGEWSDWVPIRFELLPWQQLHAQCRFYLRQIEPVFELYVSPPNIDPMEPDLPISTPPRWAADLARATDRFYSQGMPEDTKSLRTGILSPREFLQQARIAGEENLRQYRHVLSQFHDGFLFHYFGNVDQISHMMWRSMDPEHPAYDPHKDPAYEQVVDELYANLDALVGETLSTLRPDDLLIVMSDHGFTSWRRAFHLNSWLRDNGYLTVSDESSSDAESVFGNFDWTKTQAYGLGLNGLYINLEGREAFGTVHPKERDALVREISDKLLRVIDPKTGTPAITRVFRREEVYSLAGHEDRAPDLIIGYAKGTRGSDESALGGLPAEVITDNTDPWSGDHCMDPEAVPGILLASRKLRRPAPTLQTLPAAILAEFGVDDFPNLQEK